MASITAKKSAHATLTTTTVDTVTLTGKWADVVVTNNDTTNRLWVTAGGEQATVADPVALAEEITVVEPGEAKALGIVAPCVVKVLGSGGSYAVEGVDRARRYR